MYKAEVRGELINGNKTYGQITHEILSRLKLTAPQVVVYRVFIGVVMIAFGLWSMYMLVTQVSGSGG